MPIDIDWRTEYDIGVWRRVTKEFKTPSWVIPSYLSQRYSRGSCTAMPGGPYVQVYTLESKQGTRLSEYGQYTLELVLNVTWKPEIQEAVTNRRTLLGDAAHILNEYHGQAAISWTPGLLAELQRKINRVHMVYDTICKWRDETDPEWFDFYKEMHQYMLDSMKFDLTYAQLYAREHSSSVAIPGTRWFKSKKWSQLDPSELEHLYNLGKAYLEELLKNWDIMRKWIVQPNAIGRGIRARSPQVSGIQQIYAFSIDRARQVGFAPWFSTQHAFWGKEVERELWLKTKKFAEKMLACEVLLPPIEGGAFWKTIDDRIKDNESFVSGDGSNSEANVATLTQFYNYAADDGVPQWISGTAPTSYVTTWAWLQSLPLRHPGIRPNVVAELGDDQTVIGPKTEIAKIKDMEGIWSIDPIATKYKCLLGVVILPDGKGTFPGLYRVTVDRADKKIPFAVGEKLPNDKHPFPLISDIPADSYEVYREIMEHGTLKSKPFIEYIARSAEQEFYSLWRLSRDDLLSRLGSAGLEVQPEDYEIDSF